MSIQGVASGDIMTIVNTAPDSPLTKEDYPLGEWIVLTDSDNSTSKLIGRIADSVPRYRGTAEKSGITFNSEGVSRERSQYPKPFRHA